MGSRILVVEDEENIREMVRLTLKTEGHNVATAASGEEGVRQFLVQEPFNIVLLDQRLGDTTGLEVLARLREKDPNIWVIMMTAVGTTDLEERARAGGADDFLRKPFGIEPLRAAVERAVYGRTPPHRWTNIEEAQLANGFTIVSSLEEEKGNPRILEWLARIFGKRNDAPAPFRESLLVTAPDGSTRECTVTLMPEFVREAAGGAEGIGTLHRLAIAALAEYVETYRDFPPLQSLTLDTLSPRLRRDLSNL